MFASFWHQLRGGHDDSHLYGNGCFSSYRELHIHGDGDRHATPNTDLPGEHFNSGDYRGMFGNGDLHDADCDG